MSDSENIRIVIIEDDETIRDGYAFLIGQAQGYTVVSTYISFYEAAK
jgi:DNA-binding NarL/FixJ family response regulator